MPVSKWVDDPFGSILNLSVLDSWEEVKLLLKDDKAVGPVTARVWQVRNRQLFPFDGPITLDRSEICQILRELSP